MISNVDGATKLATFKPVAAAEPQPKPETQRQNHAGADSALGEMNMRASLLKFRAVNCAYKPTPPPATSPDEAKKQIDALPVPRYGDSARNLPPEDRQAIYQGKLKEYNERRAAIADGAIENSRPPRREDYEGSNGASADSAYREARASYDSQIAELKRISLEARLHPTEPPAPKRTAPDPGPEIIRRYEALRDQGPPTREDFKGLNGATAAHELREAQAYYQSELNRLSREAAPYLLKRNEEYARQTPTGRAIVDQARRQGTPVVVLPDSEYDQKFPGTAGVNSDGTIYLPVRSIDDPENADVLVHEYTHAVLGDAMRTDRPQSERVARMGDKFEQMGLDRSDGERLARETEGWKDGVAAQHAATWLLGNDMGRERFGLPRQPPEVRDELVRRAAQRELALSLTRRQDDARNGGAAYSDKQFVEDWLSTAQGRAAPPAGDTDEERAVNLRKLLEQYGKESYVLAAT